MVTARTMKLAAAFASVAAPALAAAPAAAAGIGPEIAFSTWGTRPAVYLINPDGSGRRLIYTGAQNSRISRVDMKPGGGEVSFYETFGIAQNAAGHLKTVKYEATGKLGTVTRSIPGCSYSIDYHPDPNNGSLLMVSCDQQLQGLFHDSTTPGPAGVTGPVTRARWLASGTEYIYASNNKLYRVPELTPWQTTEVLASSPYDFFATAHTSNQALGTVSMRIHRIDVDGHSTTDTGVIGECPHFSPDDQSILYMADSGSWLLIIPPGGGAATSVGRKGQYSSADWRS